MVTNDKETSEQDRKIARDRFLDAHLASIRTKIKVRAGELSDQSNGDEERCLSIAMFEYAPGDPYPVNLPWWSRVLESISGVTLLSAILAVAFGFIGLYLTTKGAQGTATGYFDTMKLFAGAIVGSAGASLTGVARGASLPTVQKPTHKSAKRDKGPES